MLGFMNESLRKAGLLDWWVPLHCSPYCYSQYVLLKETKEGNIQVTETAVKDDYTLTTSELIGSVEVHKQIIISSSYNIFWF